MWRKAIPALLFTLVLNITALPAYSLDKLDIKYSISVNDPSSHSMHVSLQASGFSDKGANFIFNSDAYSVADVISNFTLSDGSGKSLTWQEQSNINGGYSQLYVTLNGASTVNIEYDILQQYQTTENGITTLIDTDYAIILTLNTLYRPSGVNNNGFVPITDDDIGNIDILLQVPTGWDILTDLEFVENGHYRVNSLSKLNEYNVRTSMVAAGKLNKRQISFDDVEMTVAIFDEVINDGFPLSLDKFATVCKGLYQFYTAYLGGKKSKTPIVVLGPKDSGQFYGYNIISQSYRMTQQIDESTIGEQICYPWNLSHHMAHCWWYNDLSWPSDESNSSAIVNEIINVYSNVLSLEWNNLWQHSAYLREWCSSCKGGFPTYSYNDLMEYFYESYTVLNKEQDAPIANLLSNRSSFLYIKGEVFGAFLDQELKKTVGRGLSAFLVNLFNKNGGYVENPSYVVEITTLFEELNEFAPYYDWQDFFDKYVYGTEIIPKTWKTLSNGGDCPIVGHDLSFNIPCLNVSSSYYSVVFSPDGTGAWKADLITLDNANDDLGCISFDQNFKLQLPCLDYNASQFSIAFQYTGIPWFWEPDMSSVKAIVE